MKKEKETTFESVSIIEEIENQLEEILSRKKESIEKELEEKIRREKEEAQKRIQAIEEELSEEKQTLSTYRALFAEFEEKKQEIKTQIKDHLARAIELQSQIENMTAQTMNELKVVSELNQELEKLHHEALEKATSLKKTLEEKYGIVAELPESNGDTEVGVDLKRELLKLKKIKELLESNEVYLEPLEKEGPESTSEEREETVKEEVETEFEADEEVKLAAESEEKEKEEEEEEVKAGAEEVVMEDMGEEIEVEKEVLEAELSAEVKEQKGEEVGTEEVKEEEKPAQGSGLEDIYNLLEKYRKEEKIEGNGTISFYENEGKIIVDSEYLVSKMSEYVEEAKKLYIKLSQTESPREQFFVKQDIIRFQEELRKMMLGVVELCEKESCNLPEFTSEIINKEVIKDILERVTLGNWSNQEDFAAFDMYAREIKNAFNSVLTPPEKYLEAIHRELTR
ncbi:MAG: hypothetical protein DRJ11_02185 [Candidatus Aminicenantes bacterium]|nr:MAG: hypothetical protein DRJ11_02185 [Candidatus Aminicenantes bacterium]